MGAVTERLDISLEEAKAYFRVDSDVEDEVIADCVDAAKSEADAYLQNPFMDANGEALPIPSALKMWVLKRAHHHFVQRVGGVTGESIAGIGSVSYREDAFAELRPYRKKVVQFV